MHNHDDKVCDITQKTEIVLKYNQTKGGVDGMDQMAKAFTTKGKTKRWSLVIFFNVLDLAIMAFRVIFKQRYPIDTLAHEDHRQSFNRATGRALALPLIQRRSITPTLQMTVEQNISVVIETLNPKPKPSTSQPPAKRLRKMNQRRNRKGVLFVLPARIARPRLPAPHATITSAKNMQ